MTDHATALGAVRQPQLPPTAAERAAKRKKPQGKVLREKALASRQVSHYNLEKMRVMEVCGDLGAASESYARAREEQR